MEIFMSDAVRLAILWKFGGTYIDMDAITLRPLPSAKNFAGRLSVDQINLAIASFSKQHTLLD
ncbi:hypothetical protein SK128_001184, partial [Halocaridina rubra]